jgi:hypothetical protein
LVTKEFKTARIQVLMPAELVALYELEVFNALQGIGDKLVVTLVIASVIATTVP